MRRYWARSRDASRSPPPLSAQGPSILHIAYYAPFRGRQRAGCSGLRFHPVAPRYNLSVEEARVSGYSASAILQLALGL